MHTTRHQKVTRRKQRITARLQPRTWSDQPLPMLQASNIHYDVATRTHGLVAGGIGVIHRLVQRVGLGEA